MRPSEGSQIVRFPPKITQKINPCILPACAYVRRLPERRVCGRSLGLRNEKSTNNLTFNLRCQPQRLVR